jgi:hypothetical protein
MDFIPGNPWICSVFADKYQAMTLSFLFRVLFVECRKGIVYNCLVAYMFVRVHSDHIFVSPCPQHPNIKYQSSIRYQVSLEDDQRVEDRLYRRERLIRTNLKYARGPTPTLTRINGSTSTPRANQNHLNQHHHRQPHTRRTSKGASLQRPIQ